MELELRRISSDGIPHALEKAERYRLLNDPAQAESICRDVLVVDPANQTALRALILALTDQFGAYGAADAARCAGTAASARSSASASSRPPMATPPSSSCRSNRTRRVQNAGLTACRRSGVFTIIARTRNGAGST